MKKTKIARPLIKDMTIEALRKDKARCEAALRGKSLKVLSKVHYSRRIEMIDAELDRRI